MLGNVKLNTIKFLISKALINSYISHNEFVSVNNVLIEYKKMEDEVKKSWNCRGIDYINMVDISRETYKISGIETAEDNDGIL